MNLKVIFHVIACMFIDIAAAFTPMNAHAENKHSSSGQSEWVVPIFLPEIAVIPEIKTDKWIDLALLPTSNRPESYYSGFRLPHINAVYTQHKSIIEALTAECTVILIDYKEANASELAALPINNIVAIGICGPQARVITTSALTPDNNPALISADLMEFVSMAKSAGLN